jgi:uncharacterized protein (TIGR03083 family)
VTLDHLARLESTLAEVGPLLAAADPDAVVPACPGWTVRELTGHLVSGHRWAAAVVLTGSKQAVPDPGPDPLGRFEASVEALLAALRTVDPAEPCWNFAHVDERAGFWARRRTHELVVHGVDVRQACELPVTLDPELAADGIDEVFHVFLPRMLQRGAAPAVTVPVGVQATDTGDSWTLTPVADGPPRVERVANGAVATISGTAADLYLVVWGRVPTATIAIEGDHEAGTAFLTGALVP